MMRRLICFFVGHDWGDLLEGLYSLHFFCERCGHAMLIQKAKR